MKILGIVIIVAIIGIAIFLAIGRDNRPVVTPTPEESVSGLPLESAAATMAPSASVSSTASPAASKSPAAQKDIKTVTYTNNGFSPATITIKAGGTITFKNTSSRNMWPASGKHPTHTDYPTTGGCIGSTFDACKAIAPGGEWSFVFDIKGTWGYHDHVNPSSFGKIIVE